ncbi:MAG: D-glycero-beta-D-manno-heptose 1-phosphate adenylyltransferase [Thermodesulfobacteriota bacterium]
MLPALHRKVLPLSALLAEIAPRRRAGERVVFTNGCFDLLHPGHVTYLEAARDLGDLLVVGLNSDESVRRLKGPARPILPQADRAAVLAGLRSVDYVVVFEEDTPLRLIEALLPHVLVKGGDWAVDRIVGREAVEAAGGRVAALPFVEGRSTTGIVERVLERCGLGQGP